MKALVSIHDLMPHTLARVERILEWLQVRGVPPVLLLVVPGRPWQPQQIERLRQLAAAGHQLAAHGWQHTTTPRRLSHRLHAALISRKVAEHLALDSPDILALMQRAHDWFAANDLPAPDCYVPPAWALGPITKPDLARTPYHLIETTRGLIHTAGREACPQASADLNQEIRPNSPQHSATAGSTADSAAVPPQRTKYHRTDRPVAAFQKLPLTGYEADTPLRECFLRHWNASQAHAATRKKLPLRISIHPDDLDLRIADQLEQHIHAAAEFLPYSALNRY